MKRLIALMMCAVSLGAAAQLPDYVPVEGLVAYYPLDGDLMDLGPYGQDGTLFGGTLALDRFGLFSSIDFDGEADYGILGNLSPIQSGVAGEFTISLWLHLDWHNTTDINSVIVSDESSGDNGVVLQTNPYDGLFSYYPPAPYTSCGCDISFQQWHHIILRQHATGSEIILDGNIVFEGGSTNAETEKDWTIARFTEGGRFLNGKLDDIGFWNRWLTLDEILGLYNAPAPSLGCNDPLACNYDIAATHNPSQEWKVVYSAGSFGSLDVGEEAFNEEFLNSETRIIRRLCTNCNPSHQAIYYKRITDIPSSFSLYFNMLEMWTSDDNVLGTDFNLYSTLEDALNDTNAWSFCNYNDPSVAFPRDCGPSGGVAGQWNSLAPGPQPNYQFQILGTFEGCEYPVESCEGCSGETDGTGIVVLSDADGDGVCDSDEIEGCVDATACNYNSAAAIDDGSCTYSDDCGVCNGPGAIYDCGCSDVPEGDCDCNGNQFDALDVCGGSCIADTDSDGICDDVDDCVGAYDTCGVCNGPGEVYECGCADIPEGDCDCDGNVLDDLGVCGGAVDCSSYMTLSSTPSGCDASGSVTANVTECSTSISEPPPAMQALYQGLLHPNAQFCLDYDVFFVFEYCENFGYLLHEQLFLAGISYPELMNELQDLAPSSPVMQALFEGFMTPYALYCLEHGNYEICEYMGPNLAGHLNSTGISYSEMMNELQDLAGGTETNDCIVSWSDSLGNIVGEGFTVLGLPAGTYTASLTHSNGCTDTQTIEVLLECSGCTHENATNYDSTATIEDGSCLYSQETHDAGIAGVDITVDNQEAYDAGAASVECPPCANSDCPGDFTADGYIGVDDILSMLSLYDTSCSE